MQRLAQRGGALNDGGRGDAAHHCAPCSAIFWLKRSAVLLLLGDELRQPAGRQRFFDLRVAVEQANRNPARVRHAGRRLLR